MQNPNTPYQSVDTATTIPVNQPMYQQPYQGQPQLGMYQQPMMVPQQGTYQPPMAQPVAAPVYGQPLSQPVVMPPTYGDGAYERNRELQRRKLWIGIGIIVGTYVVGNIISFLTTGYIFLLW